LPSLSIIGISGFLVVVAAKFSAFLPFLLDAVPKAAPILKKAPSKGRVSERERERERASEGGWGEARQRESEKKGG
jgi:hypothetical protein